MAASYRQGLIQKLNEYCFRSIWNETAAEYRVNVRLKPVTGRYLRGSATVGSETFSLPIDNTQFLVFTTSRQVFQGGLRLPRGSWMSGDEILSMYHTLLYVYPTTGELIPRAQIYMYASPTSERVTVAIPKRAILKIFGTDYQDVYLTLYRDSDQPNLITCRSWLVDPFNVAGSTAGLLTYLGNAKSDNLEGTTVLVNGVEVDHTQTVSYVANDFVEIVCDRNVIGAYDVDVSNNTTGYYSTTTSKYREILHCPKAINPTNRLITHNTCTLTVRDSNNRGLYLHRVDDGSVGQITHNDLSVATDVIDAFRDHLDDPNVHIHVRVRAHSSDNILISELFYMTFLYRCTDEEIVRHMRGELDPALTFWRAEELEDSIYTRMMFDTPNNTVDQVLTDYVEGLGYHTVAAILAPHVYHSTLVAGRRGLTVPKPIALYGRTVRPLVWVRGKKLRADQFDFVDQLDHKVRITISDSIYYVTGDRVSVVLVERGGFQPYVFEPDVSETTITVPYKDVRIYEEITLAEPVSGYLSTTDKSYKELELQSGTLMRTQNADGTTTVIAGASLYGSTLLVQNRHFSMVDTTDLDTQVNTDKGAIVIPLSVTCFNDTNKVVPLLGARTIEVYANGYQHILDIDATNRPLTDDQGNVALSEVVLCCADYLAYGQTGNRAEIIAHSGESISYESGFIFDGKASYDSGINIWHPPLARCYVKGILAQHPFDQGTYLEPDIPMVNGDPYQLMVMLPGAVAEVLEGYDQVANLNRLTAIRNYFNREIVVDKSFIIIERSHKVYSPYLAEIVKDILTGAFEAVNDPDETHFLNQFSAYDYLKERDSSITDPEGKVDRRYADAQATYVDDWATSDPVTYAIIHRLVGLILPQDPSSLGDVLNG